MCIMELENVLIVDDDPEEIAIWSLYLRDSGCEKVDGASTVEEVKNLVTPDNTYDLYLLDSLRKGGDREDTEELKSVIGHIKITHPDSKILIYTAELDDVIKDVATEMQIEARSKGLNTMEYINGLE